MRQLEKTKELMGALVRMKPKQHEDMKLGRRTNDKKAKSSATQRRRSLKNAKD